MSKSNGRKRYAHVGLGHRATIFTEALAERFKDTCEVVGYCDLNQTRMDYQNRILNEKLGTTAPTYRAEDFERMIKETRPDWVLVTTMDCWHHMYIVRALELGCDVVTEKPMTTDALKCQQILDAQKRTGRRIVVTFNYRYSPIRYQCRRLIQDGVIGDVRSVDFNWMLDNKHGADYFRRWHRNKANSGGLLVHKATHHFDLVNWWINARPEIVYAQGSRCYAIPEQAERLGLRERGERCLSCGVNGACPYRLDIAEMPLMKGLYLDAEHEDGYFRDRCVFSPLIDIEDRICVNVRYQNGVLLSYSLNSFMPWEGYRLAINGTKGRIEMVVQESSYMAGDGSVQGALKAKESWLTVFPMFETPYQVEIPESVGGHGGGDAPLMEAVFSDDPSPDPLRRAASHIDGAYSMLVGAAANKSIATGQPVRIDSLVSF